MALSVRARPLVGGRAVRVRFSVRVKVGVRVRPVVDDVLQKLCGHGCRDDILIGGQGQG